MNCPFPTTTGERKKERKGKDGKNGCEKRKDSFPLLASTPNYGGLNTHHRLMDAPTSTYTHADTGCVARFFSTTFNGYKKKSINRVGIIDRATSRAGGSATT